MNKQKEIKLKQRIMQLTQQRQYTEAKAVAVKLVKALPKDIEIWFALAQLQERLSEYEAAVRSYYRVCQGPSNYYAAAIERSVILCRTHKLISLGLAPAKEFVKIKPNSAESHFYLGYFWFELKHYLSAEPCFLKAVEFEPDNSLFLNYCGQIYTFLAEPEKAVTFYKKSHDANVNDNLPLLASVMTHNYIDGISEQQVFDVHHSFGLGLESKCGPLVSFLTLSKVRPEKLKIGYVSEDFRQHSVAYFFRVMLEQYSRDKFEINCYSSVEMPDAMTDHLKGLSDHWCDAYGMTDEQLYQKIRADKIDILVDLAGYSGNTRLGVFAKKAAPVQVAYLGYPNTTGLSRMDYRMIDEWTDPVGNVEGLHTESLVRFKGGFLCFSASKDAPEVSPLPALKSKNSGVCFGSFNAFQKISPRLLKIWATVLLSIPNSTLYIKAKPFHEALLRERVWSIFEREGLDRKRVELVGWADGTVSHLEAYSKIDIHLDSYPYNGTTTICEALWQGVPVISLVGGAHRSRVGLSLLSQLDLDGFVARDETDYINIAIKEAADIEGLKVLRAGLRERMLNSSLMDASRFMSELEGHYEKMWFEKCSG